MSATAIGSIPLTEAAQLRDRFASNAEKIATERDLLRNLEVRAPSAMAALEEDKESYGFVTTINRVIDGSVESLIVSDNDPVSPGDVIRVERREQTPPAASVSSNEEVAPGAGRRRVARAGE